MLEILLNFILVGVLVVPEHMSYQSWLELYELADYFSEKELCNIIVYMIWSKIEAKSVDEILLFSINNQIDKLGLACGRMKIK